MQTERVLQRNDRNIEIYKIFFMPIILLLGVVPLITRLKVMEADEATQSILQSEQVLDFFSQYKSIAIVALGGIMLFILILSMGWEEMKRSKVMWVYYGGIAIYLGLSAISTFCSEYRDIAVWGMADRAEGLMVILGYAIMWFYTLYMVNKEADYKYMVVPLMILVFITGIIGFFQYIGNDLLLETDLGKTLLIPQEYASVRDSVKGQYESERIHGTMYHYNYMGSFTAMMVPMFIVLAAFTKEMKCRIACGIAFLVSTFLLFGSTSRAGLIGVGCSLIVFLIIFANKVFKNIKVIAIGIMAMVIFIFALNIWSGGSIFARIPTLINDIKAIVMPVSSDFDYKDSLPARNIETVENTIEIELQDSKLIVHATPEILYFTDEMGNEVEFTYGEEGYETQDERYKGFVFSNQRVGSGITKDYVVISYEGLGLWIVEVNTEQGAYLVDVNTYEPLELDHPETFGFRGKEKLGSARGYIWSRSLPMLKDTLLIGYGPDNYPLHFPQNDFFGKWYAYGTPYMIVDKPHNLYLQIALNQGVVALIAFLVVMILYIVQSIKLYACKEAYSIKEIMGSACLVAVVGYLGAGLFNDSVVSVAPIFWVILAFGMATNYLMKYETNLN